MPTTNCSACGGLVNEAVIKCPHCGEKQERGAPVYSKAEIQALIDNDDALTAHQGSSALFKALLAPHKHTRGLMRLVELVLTGVTLPAVLLGALGIALLGGRRSKGAFSTSGEIAPVVVMTLLGGGTIAMWLGGQYAIIAISAMWARAAIRMISAGQAERAMIEADQRAPRSALPPSRAQVASAPARASLQELPTARVVTAPSRPPAPAPSRPAAPAPSTSTPSASSAPAAFAPPPADSGSRPSGPIDIVDPAKARAAAQAQSSAQPRPATSPERANVEPGDEPSILR